MKKRVFLGGTWAETTWRYDLEKDSDIEYFDPVVDNWTPAWQEVENDEKDNKCNIHLYVITSAMEGVYSIAEAVQSSNTPDKITVFHVLPEGFTEAQLKSLEAVCKLLKRNKALAYIDSRLQHTAEIIRAL